MLRRIYIRNFAIVDELEVTFENGFQVITGETGAGKSILIGALALICGERSQVESVRTGEQKAVVEAEFSAPENVQIDRWLEEWEIEPNPDGLILRREISARGGSRAFINDTPCPAGNLSVLSAELVDLHGQHQHQRLLHPEYHLTYLDAFAKAEPLLEKYRQAFEDYRRVERELKQLREQVRENQEQQDLFAFQLDEITKLGVGDTELEDLVGERNLLENSEQIFEVTNMVSDRLYAADETALSHVMQAIHGLQQIAHLNGEFAEMLESLQGARLTLQEVGRSAGEFAARLEFDPQRLEEIRSREAEIEFMLKKYRVKTVDDLLLLRDSLEQKLNRIRNFDEEIAKSDAERESARQKLEKIAVSLSEVRSESGAVFADKIVSVMKDLGMPNARFECRVNREEDPRGLVSLDGRKFKVNDQGIDVVEFLVSVNAGENPRPLQKVASGGEVSRIMLSIKALMASSDRMPTMVFDEIDSGISGKVAQIVGRKMAEISRDHQLLVITHLPQIAAQGDGHYAVVKMEENGRTSVTVKRLDINERVDDIARLLTGEVITEQARANAQELLRQKA
jgi:DNA repair protein RecN (Recombination protein N)